jgi:hypothetical protein
MPNIFEDILAGRAPGSFVGSRGYFGVVKYRHEHAEIQIIIHRFCQAPAGGCR